MVPEIKPIFLFSLPRSGSTLVQRILASSAQISTVSEPWILLPLLAARRLQGTFADYSHLSAFYAIGDFINNLPDQETTYRAEVRRFILNLYGQVAVPGAEYFLDKTPRYHNFAHEIMNIFGDDARYIFLWRNPLSIIASMIETGGGRWNLSQYKVDIYHGLENLIRTYQNSQSNVIAVNYENLVGEHAGLESKKMFDYIGVDFSPSFLSNFSDVRLKGTAGDQSGTREYHTLSTAPLQKWKTILSNPIRKKWSKNYLRWIGENRLSAIGYSLDDLIRQIDSLHGPWQGVGADLGRMAFGEVRCVLSLRSIYYNIQKIPDLKNILSLEY